MPALLSSHSARRLCAFAVLAISLSACSQPHTSDASLADFAFLEGEWTGTHRVMGVDADFTASYQIAIEDGDTLIHEFQSDWNGGFTGREELRVAPDGKRFSAHWTDSADPNGMESIGSFDQEARTLEMFGYGVDWEQPDQQVLYRHRTVYQDSSFSYTMSVQQEEGLYTEVMWIEMNRAD